MNVRVVGGGTLADTLLCIIVQLASGDAPVHLQAAMEAAVVDKLSTAHPNMTVMRREELPDRFHFRAHRRICPVLALADEGWLLQRVRTAADNATLPSYKWGVPRGEHGYDNQLRSMQGIFAAAGPAFRENATLPSALPNTDVYALLCRLVGITPAPNNGTLSALFPLLAP